MDTMEILDNERIVLLQKIQSLEQEVGLNSSLPQNASRDPLETLPFELWEAIIHDALSSDSHPETWVIDQLLDLTSVSMKWAKSILYSPAFWTNITITSEEEDLKAKVVLCTHLSGKLPLNLHYILPLPFETWKEIQAEISDHSFRIQSIHLFGNAPIALNMATSFEVGIEALLNSLGDLPSLSAFTSDAIGSENLEPYQIIKGAKNIRSMSGVNILKGLLRLDSVQNLRQIAIEEPITDALPLIQRFQYLKEVTFRYVPLNTDEERRSFTDRLSEEDKAIRFDSAYLPWRVLRIYQNIFSPILPLLRCLSSTLVELRIAIDWHVLPDFLATCGHMRKLEHLHLRLPCAYKWYFDEIFECVEVSPIHRLFVHAGDHSFSDREKAEGPGTSHANTFLFNALTTWAPFVNELNVLTCSTGLDALHYAKSLHNLAIFSLEHTFSPSVVPDSFTISTVERVKIVATNTILLGLNCPSALTLSATFNIYAGGFGTSLNLQPERWSNLRTLKLDVTIPHDWVDISLPYVETITVSRNGPSLIQQLGLCPTIFPSLKHLRMQRFPDWDILFIMLERRNFQPQKGISMIRTLGLPFAPSPIIIKPLAACLRGQFSERPSNFELSFDSMAPMFFDVEIPGCSYCHRAFTSCDYLLTSFGMNSDQSDLSQLPPYPETSGEVLSSYDKRYEAWIPSIAACTRGAESACNRLKSQLTEITGYSHMGL